MLFRLWSFYLSSFVTTSPAAASPEPSSSLDGLPLAHLLPGDLNGFAYPSLACCSSGSLGGLTCVTEGLTSVFHVGAVPRRTLRFLLPPPTGRVDDRRLEKQLSCSLNTPLKLPFPGLSYSTDSGLCLSQRRFLCHFVNQKDSHWYTAGGQRGEGSAPGQV